MKKVISLLAALCMLLALTACSAPAATDEKTVPTADPAAALTTDEPAADAPQRSEDELWKLEPAYGQTYYYEYDTGNCTQGPLFAKELGYFDEMGLSVEGLSGNAIVEALGTNKAQFGVHHIAHLMVPATNGTSIVFTAGAQTGCKSLYVLADSDIQTTADLIGKKVSPPTGIGSNDYNIAVRFFQHDDINPLTEIDFTVVEQNACVVAMQNGEIDAAVLPDYYAWQFVQDGTLRVIRSLTWDEDFQQEPCCVLAFNATFARENPITTKKLTACVEKAHQWIQDNPDEATQMLLDYNCTSGSFEMNKELLVSQNFGITDEQTETALRTIVSDYIELGLITAYDDVDAVMELVWNPVLLNDAQ